MIYFPLPDLAAATELALASGVLALADAVVAGDVDAAARLDLPADLFPHFFIAWKEARMTGLMAALDVWRRVQQNRFLSPVQVHLSSGPEAVVFNFGGYVALHVILGPAPDEPPFVGQVFNTLTPGPDMFRVESFDSAVDAVVSTSAAVAKKGLALRIALHSR